MIRKSSTVTRQSVHVQQIQPPIGKKLDFQAKAKSKIGSLKNASHKPPGGDKKVNLIYCSLLQRPIAYVVLCFLM